MKFKSHTAGSALGLPGTGTLQGELMSMFQSRVPLGKEIRLDHRSKSQEAAWLKT